MQTLRPVVITGAGVVSPFGKGLEKLATALRAGESGVSRLPEPAYRGHPGPQTAGLVCDVDITEIPRKNRRSMSAMSVYSLMAAKEALAQAGLPEDSVTGGRLGISIGSTLGSVDALETVFREYLSSGGLDGVKSTMFFKFMGHSVAANVGQALGVTGRIMGASAACSSGAQSIGFGYEAVACGMQDYMLCGGADEYHPLFPGTFDLMAAASIAYTDRPTQTPRPFDKHRDGVVCSEGAGVLLLESLESARQRGAPILAEIVGFASTADPSSIASPDPRPVGNCMRQALESAGLKAADIGYVNAHATGTPQGDVAEGQAIAALFGSETPVSSLKGHLGHTMAASGAIECAACLIMLRDKLLFPTRNLDNPDEECGTIRHLRDPEAHNVTHIIKNSFAFGGINCSLILRNAS